MPQQQQSENEAKYTHKQTEKYNWTYKKLDENLQLLNGVEK